MINLYLYLWLVAIGIATIVIIMATVLRYSKVRGILGEQTVKGILEKLPQNKYLVLNDILIRNSSGTHQIDHIVLSNYGIFVIETKNYMGIIRGSEQNENWLQFIKGKKYYFYNPIRQNYDHVKTLSELLKIEEKYFIPVVCLSNNCEFKVNTKKIVVQMDYLEKEILNHTDITNDFNLYELAGKILINNLTDKKAKEDHAKEIMKRKANDKELADNMICPKCGSNLTEREGKYGKFIGCENYPKCHYTKVIH